MEITEDKPERIVIDNALTPSKSYAACMIPLLAIFVPLGGLMIFSDDASTQNILIGLAISGGALFGVVNMALTMLRPALLFRVVLEPPQRKVTLQNWSGTQLKSETTLGVAPHEEFDFFYHTYVIRYKGSERTAHRVSLAYGDPRKSFELLPFMTSAEAEAFLARVREAFDMS